MGVVNIPITQNWGRFFGAFLALVSMCGLATPGRQTRDCCLRAYKSYVSPVATINSQVSKKSTVVRPTQFHC